MEGSAVTGDSPGESSSLADPGRPAPPPSGTTPPSGSGTPPRRRRWLRRLAWIGGTLVTILVAAFIYVRWSFNGVRLARLVTHDVLNKMFQGRTTAETIEWPASAIFDPRHVDVVIKGVHVYDPHNRLVLWLPRVEANIDAWEIIKPAWLGGHGDIIVHELHVPEGFCDVVEELDYNSPYGSTVGFVAAFTRRPVVGAGPLPAGFQGPLINLHGARLEHIDLNLEMLGWHARLHDINTNAWLWMSQRDIHRPEFM
jgi:hypothetical protein